LILQVLLNLIGCAISITEVVLQLWSSIYTLGIRRVLVSDTTLTPTFMITLNYIIFSNYYWCWRASVRIVSGIRLCVCAS
jgi:hypothetical protein